MNWRTENCVTLIVIACLILGLFYMSHSWHSLWALLLLLNINYKVNP